MASLYLQGCTPYHEAFPVLRAYLLADLKDFEHLRRHFALAPIDYSYKSESRFEPDLTLNRSDERRNKIPEVLKEEMKRQTYASAKK